MRFRQLLVICFICCLQMRPMAQQSSSETQILDLESKWTEAYKVHSVKEMPLFLDEKFVITIEDGRTFGKVGYIAHTADASVHVEVAEESDLQVHLHGNVAVVTGAYHETGTAQGKRYEYHDRLTDVWMKKNNGPWQIIAAQYSVPLQP
jgi:ketosteroid isomerase-like protein